MLIICKDKCIEQKKVLSDFSTLMYHQSICLVIRFCIIWNIPYNSCRPFFLCISPHLQPCLYIIPWSPLLDEDTFLHYVFIFYYSSRGNRFARHPMLLHTRGIANWCQEWTWGPPSVKLQCKVGSYLGFVCNLSRRFVGGVHADIRASAQKPLEWCHAQLMSPGSDSISRMNSGRAREY